MMSDDQADDDEIIEEFEISFSPRLEALASRDISLDDFEAALIVALEARQALSSRMDFDEDEISTLEEMELTIRGATYKVEDLADVDVQSSGDHDS